MIPHDKFIDKIKQYIDEKKLFSFGDHVIIGLSGGADSVCLLLVLKRLQQIYNLSITAIHVHHGIRGESAEHDLKFSRQLCEKEEIEFVEKRCDVPALAAKHHLTAGTTSNHHAPYVPGYTRNTMAINRGKQSREAEQIPKSRLSSDCRLKPACMKLELLVIADQHAAVNTFPGLVHTARHTMRVGNTRSP